MDIEQIGKVAVPILTAIGIAWTGWVQLFTTRRSQSYQNYKTELELLRQPTDSSKADLDFERFLVNVRKEKIAFVAFGMPIPNSELERLIAYYEKGKATTRDIAKAWRYRNPTKKELSFELSKPVKWMLLMVRMYVMLCLAMILGLAIVAMEFTSSGREVAMVAGGAVVLFAIAMLIARSNEGLFIAERLAKLEKERSKLA